MLQKGYRNLCEWLWHHIQINSYNIIKKFQWDLKSGNLMGNDIFILVTYRNIVLKYTWATKVLNAIKSG